MKLEKILKALAQIIIIAAVGAGCFFWGFSRGKQAEEKDNKKERELEATINRSDLEGLGDIEGTIYVTGHMSPDTDTVCSTIAYATLLKKLGYDAAPVVLGKINNETKFILEEAGVETPELMEDATGKNFVLVDHGDYSQSAEGMEDANVISIIDHHGDGTVSTGNQLIYDARPLGSTATIIWIRYRNYGVEIDKSTAFIMLGAILSDTKNLQSEGTTSADREAVKELSDIAEVSDVDALFDEQYKAFISHEGMTDEEIYLSDYKEYEAGDKKYSIGCISVYDEEEAKEMVERMNKILPSMKESKGMDLAYISIGIFHDDFDITYIIPADDASSDVIKEAFPDTGEFDGTAYVFNPGVSRKRVVVPAITEVLE